MKIYKSITELIGKTPLLELCNYGKQQGLNATIAAKLEYFNPTGSAKDRVALSMIENAERVGILNPDSVIIEPTSGNTGIGLAAIAARKGYKTVITMPETMSPERIKLMKAYGAQVVLTDGKKGMSGAIEKAEQIALSEKNAFIPGQFTNPANPEAHYLSTGPEIWSDTDGKVDIFVAGIGTGGTVSGTGRFLKSKNPDIKIIGVEPYSSPVLSKGKSGAHGIQGIGAGFVPETLDTSVYDEIVAVKDSDAFLSSRELARTEGILTGISSGAALYAAAQVALRSENRNKLIVVLLPDTGERYLSSPVFGE